MSMPEVEVEDGELRFAGSVHLIRAVTGARVKHRRVITNQGRIVVSFAIAVALGPTVVGAFTIEPLELYGATMVGGIVLGVTIGAFAPRVLPGMFSDLYTVIVAVDGQEHRMGVHRDQAKADAIRDRIITATKA